MEQELLLEMPPPNTKPVWKRWKWIGLLVFALVLLLQSRLPGVVVVFGWIFGVAATANLAFLLFRYLRNLLFWRVRYRLLASFVFAGLIPLLLLAGIVGVAAYIFGGQLASHFAQTEVTELGREVTGINAEIGQQVGYRAPAEFDALASGVFDQHQSQFPKISARLIRKLPNGAFETIRKYDPAGIARDLEPYRPGLWADKGMFEGLLRHKESLFLTSLRPVPGSADLYVDVTAPVDAHIEKRMEEEKSLYAVFMGIGKKNVQRTNKGEYISTDANGTSKRDLEMESREHEFNARLARDARRKLRWMTLYQSKNYDDDKDGGEVFAQVAVPFETLYDNYLAGNSDLRKVLSIALAVLLGLFLTAELISLLVGMTISRKVTQSIHDMYRGILALKQGNFQHAIPVRRNDQLGLLAHSFNQMSASITRLLEEVSEKKRLEQELEIAREVQATLFPKQLPHPRGLTVFGGCEPARVVSGDYYDFIIEDESHLHIVVGDISGKGISAALLMANLQAAMRNQLMSFKKASTQDVERTLSGVMVELNSQIYLNSPSEKYATLFASLYEAEARRLYYCNAGHLPPILMSNGELRRLEAGGTVLGLFPTAGYQSASVELPRGAVLAIFTDGVTEAVNDKDEEFGEQRLIESLRDARHQPPEIIYRNVVRCVQEWQGTLRQHDDITLIIAKAE